MNQILSVEMEEKKRKKARTSSPVEIKKILKIFAIVMIIFGVSIIGSGSYGIYKGGATVATKPRIVVTQQTGTQVQIEITHDKPLAKVTYSWNGQEPIAIETNLSNTIKERIDISSGSNNRLTVYAEDINKQAQTNESMYTEQKKIDIQLEANGTELKISMESEKELAYMTYRWDEEVETRVDLTGHEAEEAIEIPKGQHTLTLIVVDIENNTEIKEQEVKAVTKPKLEVSVDESGENFVIKASDEEAVKRIEFIINPENENGERNSLDLDKVWPSADERKEFEYAYPLKSGDNKLIIRAYNESGVYEEARVMFRK